MAPHDRLHGAGVVGDNDGLADGVDVGESGGEEWLLHGAGISWLVPSVALGWWVVSGKPYLTCNHTRLRPLWWLGSATSR